MEFLQSIPGPVFLPMYIIYLVAVMLVAKSVLSGSNTSAGPMPGLDLTSIAYLKGGAPGVMQAVFFDLWNRGLVEVSPNGQAIVHNDRGPMNSLETTVAQELTTYTSLSIALNRPTPATRQRLASYLDPIAKKLEDAGYLMNEAARSRQKSLKWVFLAAGLLPGVLKAYLGFTNNRPSGFLVLLMIGFVIVALVLMRSSKGPTAQAKKFMQGMASQYRNDLNTLRGGQTPQTNPALLAAVFGIGAIALAYSPLMNLFPSSVAGSYYGCTTGFGCTHSSGCTTGAGCSNSSGCSSSSGCSGSSGCGGGGGCGGCGGGD